MSERTFLFGIGAAKAGTSWLYNYLYSHPDCHFRALKELHYFNSIQGKGSDWPRKSRQRRLISIQKKLNSVPSTQDKPRLLQLRADIEEWNDVFDGKTANDAAYVDFLTQGGDSTSLAGEITPAYATLDEAGFRRMASLGGRTRFIMLLRDPLDRMWSNVRMSSQRKVARLGGSAQERAEAQTEAFIKGENNDLWSRSDYRGTISRLLKIVPRENVLFEFFEQLFTPEAVRRITDFLGIRPKEGEFTAVRNKGQAMVLPDALRQRALVALAPQYDYIRSQFGDLVPAKWHDPYGQLETAGH